MFFRKSTGRKSPRNIQPVMVDWPNALSRKAEPGTEEINFLPVELKLEESPMQETSSDGWRLLLVSLLRLSPRPLLGNSPNLSSSGCISTSGCPFCSLYVCFSGDWITEMASLPYYNVLGQLSQPWDPCSHCLLHLRLQNFLQWVMDFSFCLEICLHSSYSLVFSQPKHSY